MRSSTPTIAGADHRPCSSYLLVFITTIIVHVCAHIRPYHLTGSKVNLHNLPGSNRARSSAFFVSVLVKLLDAKVFHLAVEFQISKNSSQTAEIIAHQRSLLLSINTQKQC